MLSGEDIKVLEALMVDVYPEYSQHYRKGIQKCTREDFKSRLAWIIVEASYEASEFYGASDGDYTMYFEARIRELLVVMCRDDLDCEYIIKTLCPPAGRDLDNNTGETSGSLSEKAFIILFTLAHNMYYPLITCNTFDYINFLGKNCDK